MRRAEVVLFGLSWVAIAAVFAAELVRWHGTPSARLSPSMLLFLRISLGIVFAILGVIGSLLPIMQGWLFFLLSGLVLFPQSRFAVKALEKVEPRMPRLVARLRRYGIGVQRDADSVRVR